MFRHFKSSLWEICTDKSLAVKYAIRPSRENTLYRATIKKFIKENLEAASFNVSKKTTTIKKIEIKNHILTLTALGPSLLAIERTVTDPSRLLNDFGVPSLNRVPFANPNLSTDPGNC